MCPPVLSGSCLDGWCCAIGNLIALTTYNYYLQSTLIYVIYSSEDITQVSTCV